MRAYALDPSHSFRLEGLPPGVRRLDERAPMSPRSGEATSMNPSDVHVVLCTCPAEAVEVLSRRLVEGRLVACVNVIPAVRSVYRWEGKVEEETESLLIMKTQRARLTSLIEALESEHPYDVPEVLALPVEAGSSPYLDWVIGETKLDSE